jgi:hypothetical protein
MSGRSKELLQVKRGVLIVVLVLSSLAFSSARVHAAPVRALAVTPICPGLGLTISVGDGGYSPSTLTSMYEITQKWQWRSDNTTAESVTSTDFKLFSSPLQVTGRYSFHFFAAGTYRYHSRADASQKGNVKVLLCMQSSVTRSQGAIVVYADKHHSGWVSDVEVKKKGDARWHWLGYGLTGTQLTFKPAQTGTYYLRARLRRTSSGNVSPFSPQQPLHVS